jgi:hypothetical protein
MESATSHEGQRRSNDEKFEDEPYSRLGHLADALRPTTDSGDLLVVPLTFYGDASFNEADVGPPSMVVAGFLTSAKLWKEFEKRWAKMLARFDIAYFRMVDLAHFKGPFKPLIA